MNKIKILIISDRRIDFKSMYILGISAYYHDSAAALIKDGKVIAAAEEERFSRIKHDNSFPYQAINFCLKFAKISLNAVDVIAYYEKPLLKFERILETFIETFPFALKPFLKAIPEWLDYKIKIEHTIRKKLGFRGKIYFIPHHFSHASSTFYSSPFKKAAILTIDGVGEYQTTGLWKGEENKIYPIKSINFPHSLGLLYSTFTSFLGFKINEDEYKVMGLAAYGKPIYTKKIYSVIKVKDDGSFQLNLDFFSFRESFTMWNKNFEKIFGKPRKSIEKIEKRHQDLAASIQKVTEEIYFKILFHLFELTKTENLCLAGGVALNALANGKIYQNTPFKNVYIFGAAGDNGAALGASFFVYHQLMANKKRCSLTQLYFGPQYSDNKIENELKRFNLQYQRLDKKSLVKTAARLLSEGKIVGWFEDRMEFGPRALGNRSILCKPNSRSMKTKMNLIKKREQFRPFAGSILQEKVEEYFIVPEKDYWSPFMTFCFLVRKEKRKELAAIVHADGSCRIQTVNQENGLYYQLIYEFYRITGIPCLLNTSFNLKGEPIVENPKQAIEDFLKTRMDYLVIGDFIVGRG